MMRVMVHLDDGSEVDVTDGVQALYDIVIQSMDWGSGFLSVEDALPVLHVAKTCGFEDWQAAQVYVNSPIQNREEAEWRERENFPVSGPWGHLSLEHRARGVHEFSSVGECLFPTCDVRNY